MATSRARRLAGIALVLCLMAGSAVDARGQQLLARFPITQAADSIIHFPVGTFLWVAPGWTGIAVDPAKRDEVVAQFRVLRIENKEATALITGQTTVVTTQHVALLQPPSAPRWYRRSTFWRGLLVGGALGALAGALIGR